MASSWYKLLENRKYNKKWQRSITIILCDIVCENLSSKSWISFFFSSAVRRNADFFILQRHCHTLRAVCRLWKTRVNRRVQNKKMYWIKFIPCYPGQTHAQIVQNKTFGIWIPIKNFSMIAKKIQIRICRKSKL